MSEQRATTLLRDSLRELQRLRAELARAREPIAIVGMACRAPGSIDGPERLWQLLSEGRDVIRELPERWAPRELDAARRVSGAGTLTDIEDFDPELFRIAPREAATMDPQQRLVLELAWEALERAGLDPTRLGGSATGVFLGATVSDYLGNQDILESVDGQALTGNSPSVLAGRVAYALGLRGPALSVDTACSSSLVSLLLACESLRRRECARALAGGVHLMCTPATFAAFERMGVSAPDGRCKAFGAEADGAGWSEGGGLLVLERLSDAQAASREVLALIRGGATNHDGRSQGLTAPSGASQRELLSQALVAAELEPGQIDVVEAHGTGTPLGDRIEAGVLAEVFGPRREPGRPLWLGSLKSNLGHTQCAAGVLGVIKMVLALGQEQLPRTLHAEVPNPAIDWSGSGLALLQSAQPWPRRAEPRRAGVSSFGISGTNAHLIVEEAPAAPRSSADRDQLRGPLLVAAHSPVALEAQARRWADWLRARPDTCWSSLVRSAAARAQLGSRAAVLAGDTSEALPALEALAEGRAHPSLVVGRARRRESMVFVFPGQGSQWPAMGQALLRESPAFAARLRECDAALAPHTGWSVQALLAGEHGPALADDERIQPALFAMALGLVAAWRERGVEPDAVVGHSQGEIAAAVVAGALSLEHGARLVWTRAKLVASRPGGAMLMIGRPVAAVEAQLRGHEAVSIAVVNGESATIVAGARSQLVALEAECAAAGVFCRWIKVSYASHSPHMDPLLEPLARASAWLRPEPAAIEMVSSVRGESLSGPELDARYWCDNLREPVRFDRALARLRERGHATFVEISAHPLLSTIIEDSGALSVPTLSRGRGGLIELERSAARLHVEGYDLDASTSGPRAPLPTQAFVRRSFGVSPRASLSPFTQPPSSDPVADMRRQLEVFQTITQRQLETLSKSHL